ncbi:MAG: NifX-associated nitrogen fixation protein [Planctomycetaceae bacterium]|nr:NifX-associated nitrogen fixation protein [Planctomycetaceae bacterium]
MSHTTVEFVETGLTKELVKQMRALDTNGENDKLPPQALIAPFIVTKEQKREIPVVGDPDEETLNRVHAFYNAISALIEQGCGLMAIPSINLTHEGFGRGLLTVGSLVVFDKTLRDVHRFGFNTFEQMEAEAQKIVSQALALVQKYREVAEL